MRRPLPRYNAGGILDRRCDVPLTGLVSLQRVVGFDCSPGDGSVDSGVGSGDVSDQSFLALR